MTRRTTRLRPIHFVLSLLLALAGVVAVGGPAQAAVDSISGTVTTPANTSGINVYLSQDVNTGSGPAFDGTTPVTSTDINGDFSFTGVPNGDYLLVVDAGDDWVQYFSFETIDGVTLQTPLSVDLQPGVAIYGTVLNAAPPYSALQDIIVFAIGDSSSFPIFDWLSMNLDIPSPFGGIPLTGISGGYRIVVPIDDSYEVAAIDLGGTFAAQSWDHRTECGCDFDPIVIPDLSGWPHAPILTTDFDLLAYDDWIWFSVLVDDLNGVAKVGMLIHLDRWNGLSWDLDIDTQLTDSAGYADLFALGDGDYRLRFSEGGLFKAIDSWFEPLYFSAYPLYDSGRSVELPGLLTGCGCGDFTTLEVDLVFPVAASSGGGSTPGIPRRPASTSGATFSLSTPTPTPTPSATPTSSPSPSSSPSAEPSASPEPTDEPEPTSNPLDLWWLWLLLLLILALIVFFVVRLFRGRA